jgi:hypothetical protein
LPAQPLTWNEMRSRAHSFVAEWRGETRERAEAQSFWNDWFSIFGITRRRFVTFEKNATRVSTGRDGSLDAFWPNVVAIEHKSEGKDLPAAIDQALDYLGDVDEADMPRLVIASDFSRFRVMDMDRGGEVYDFDLDALPEHLRDFAFLAGYRERVWEEEPQANIAAAELMAELFDQMEESGYSPDDLARWLVRLLFCLFADDTGVWERGLFYDLISNTRPDARDVGGRVSELFEVLNTPEAKRYRTLDDELARFPYVNGQLFSQRLPIPSFSGGSRRTLLRCCSFDWAAVSPAVFGSMFQAVLEKDERRRLGAHYTSEQSILKAIEPLFLDALKADLERCKNSSQLERYQKRLGALRVLDPACGCGNFLVVSYRELRKLELECLKRLRSSSRNNQGQFLTGDISPSIVDVDQFYGIEVEEFPARIAEVALYLVDHQANMELSREFGEYLPRIPLRASPNLVTGNALRVEWNDLIPSAKCSYVVGNPPYRGKKIRSAEQQDDMSETFPGWKSAGLLDYVACWYKKTFDYIEGTEARAALVSTNSVCQGEQVSILWPALLDRGLDITFAHRTFEWMSEARGRAAVHVVVIGFRDGTGRRAEKKMLFDHPRLDSSSVVEMSTQAINPYLVPGQAEIVSKRRAVLADAPEMEFGSMPNDDGELLLDDDEAEALRSSDPVAAKYLRRLIGSKPMLHNVNRWCLWCEDISPADVRSSEELRRRAERVKNYRASSNRAATKKLADYPLLFGERRQPEGTYLCVPRHSSQYREYVPMAFFGCDDIAHDSIMTIDNADQYIFGILSSNMFTTWLSTVGGRIKSDYRISAEIVYNNFPFPDASSAQRRKVEAEAERVLSIRRDHPDTPLADLYDQLAMPVDLKRAHRALDRTVQRLFQPRAHLVTELQRQEELFQKYAKMLSQAICAD